MSRYYFQHIAFRITHANIALITQTQNDQVDPSPLSTSAKSRGRSSMQGLSPGKTIYSIY